MISAYKTALYLSKDHQVVVLTTGTPRTEKINANLTVYRMWDIFLPDPINYSVVPGLFISLVMVLIKERPTHFLVNKNMFFTSLAIPFLRLLGKKVITVTDTYPGINWLPRNPKVALVMRIYAHLIGMPLLKISSHVVLLHEGLVEIAKQYRLRFTVIHNGVDLEAIDATPANAQIMRDKTTKVLYAGRLESIKGYTDIVKVAEKITRNDSKVSFYLVGSTAGKEQYVTEHQSDRVHFLGHRTDVISIMKACDIFILASYSEGLPNVIMEAMACGVPCVASEVGGVKVLIENQQNGLLFTPGDLGTMQKQLKLLINDASMRHRLASQARRLIEAKFSWAKIAQQYQQLFTTIGSS